VLRTILFEKKIILIRYLWWNKQHIPWKPSEILEKKAWKTVKLMGGFLQNDLASWHHVYSLLPGSCRIDNLQNTFIIHLIIHLPKKTNTLEWKCK